MDPKLALANEISQRSLIAADDCIGGVELVEGDGEKQKTTSEYILRKNKGKVKKPVWYHLLPRANFEFKILTAEIRK